ncbi:MAG: hypothetical protein KDC24_14405, partial [Saprospiraceae bacterium]|nr:hypothetical protein [Saprospiraceae bacterium]
MNTRLLKTLLPISLLVSLLITPKSLFSQCAMACDAFVVIGIQPDSTFELHYSVVLEGDICPGTNSFSMNPADTVIQLSGNNLGTVQYMVTNLETGNACWGEYRIVNSDCNVDILPPIITNRPPSSILIGCNDSLPVYNITAYDECDPSVLITESTQVADPTSCTPNRVIRRRWTAYDDAGNSSFVVQDVNYSIAPGFTVDLPGDNVIACGNEVTTPELTVSDSPCSTFGENYTDVIVNGGGCSKIVRTHYLLDWCGYDGSGPGLTAPEKDIDGDGNADAYTIHTDGINWYDGTTILGPYNGFLTYTSEIKLPSCSDPYADCKSGIT